MKTIQPPASVDEAGIQTSAMASDAAERLDSRMNAERSFKRDVDTGTMIYRLIDLSSGIVTVQTPNDARLKLRAYIDGVMTAAQQPGVEMTA